MKKKKAIFRWLILAISVLFLLIFLNSSKETSVIKQLGAKIFKTKAENSTEDITIPRLNINGDGIDSNGYIYINGGTVYGFCTSR